MKILVSACLLGENCKYNGGNNYSSRVMDFIGDREVVPVCPELAAGLGCPRVPMEIVGGVLTDRDGRDVDAVMRRTVAQIVESLKDEQIGCAVLKSRSPTCGVRQVYDGTFTGTLVPGMGVLAQALADAGYTVMDSDEV
ncbi:MAG: DUF523 domain-containing protein [Oscillospiraceae bacterium]|nr:DUF523 domain-containing protein [Oscillospiraceae bacterium]